MASRIEIIDTQAGGGLDRAALQSKAADALEFILWQPRSLSLSEITRVTREINSGPWALGHRLRMASALSDAYIAPSPVGMDKKKCGWTMQSQKCGTLDNYFPICIWGKLASWALPESTKVCIIASPIYKCGMHMLGESSLELAGTMLQAMHVGYNDLGKR